MHHPSSPAGRSRAVGLAACAAVALLLASAPVSAQTAAQIVSPQANATWHPADPISWSPVAGATAYYLYVGRSPGLKDLVDTGEIQATSWVPATLPAGLTVYARLWTKFSSGWKYTDRPFIAGAAVNGAPAVLQSPATGTQAAGGLPVTFSWSASSGALAYYLYVGTTEGGKDLVDSGETPLRSVTVPTLPPLRTLYARIWTKSATGWQHTDSWFTTSASPPPATVVTPADGQMISVGGPVTFTWTSMPGALAYYLYVGTAPGLNDVVNYGETSVTSVSVSGLPGGRTLYLRMWTKLPGSWQYRDSIVRTRALLEWRWPLDGARHVPGPLHVSWLPATGAIDYQLALGTTLDASDVAFQDGITGTSFDVTDLPAGSMIYGRLTARLASGSVTSRIAFGAAGHEPGVWSTFVYPTDNLTGVSSATTFRWSAVPNALAYYLYVGRRPGALDVFDSGETSSLSVDVGGLPRGPLFARLWTRLASGWRYADVTFTTDSLPGTPLMAYPTDGAQGVDTAYPLQWFAVPGADAYRLELARTPGAHDLLDSGVIALPRRFAPPLPSGTIYGRVSARVSGVWVSTSFTFTAGASSNGAEPRFNAALWAATQVREMTNDAGAPRPGTELARVVGGPSLGATCAQYSIALSNVLYQSGANVSPTYVNTCLNATNSYDCHTLIQAIDPRSGAPLLLDPTFGVTLLDQSATRFLSASDMGAATGTHAFDSVKYQFLSKYDDSVLRSYYLDYPLLYFSLAPGWSLQQGPSPLQFFQSLGQSVSGGTTLYAVQCQQDGAVTFKVNGVQVSDVCAGPDRLTHVFFGGSISPAGQPIGVWNVLRFRF